MRSSNFRDPKLEKLSRSFESDLNDKRVDDFSIMAIDSS